MDFFETDILARIQPAIDLTIQLGMLDFRLVSNVPNFPAQKYFSAKSQSVYKGKKTDFELWCISISKGSLEPEKILPYVDQTYRGKSFLRGYYVTDHFGSPIHLVTRENRCYVFGEELEHVVWPYFVKYFLMLKTIQNALFLKAAACSVGTAGTLLLGRGGAGKTVFLTQLCLHGAQFLSNSHSIIEDRRICGVTSSIRIRPGYWYEDLTKKIETNNALIPGELIIDPYDAFTIDPNVESLVKNICILDYTDPGRHVIKTIHWREVYDYAEQFSLAINVYRLEEDLLDHFSGDFHLFSEVYSQMKLRLQSFIERSRCFYISSDMLNPSFRADVLDALTTE